MTKFWPVLATMRGTFTFFLHVTLDGDACGGCRRKTPRFEPVAPSELATTKIRVETTEATPVTRKPVETRKAPTPRSPKVSLSPQTPAVKTAEPARKVKDIEESRKSPKTPKPLLTPRVAVAAASSDPSTPATPVVNFSPLPAAAVNVVAAVATVKKPKVPLPSSVSRRSSTRQKSVETKVAASPPPARPPSVFEDPEAIRLYAPASVYCACFATGD